tara:strand:+ start:1015 stop:1317 length:303 start_codon:yes stop_codon:yes gene_type:complete
MALRKREIEDKIEVVGEQKTIQIRKATIVEEGTPSSGYTELSRSFSRTTLSCIVSVQNPDDSWTHTDTNVSGESTEVQAVANAVWTDAVKVAARAANEAV